MSEDAMLKIRPIRPEDIEPLEALGHRAPGLAEYRLAEQEVGQSLVFVALVDDEIVGHAVLTWEGAGSPPLPRLIEECPNVSDIWVRPEWRRKGIGTALLEACESVAADQKFPRLGLSVGLDNLGATALYEARGYADAGLPPYRERGQWLDARGEVVAWDEMCRYLVRDLSRDGS